MNEDQEKRQIIERVACQCYVDHDDTYVWGTLPEEDKAPYIQQAEYWTRLLRYFKLREAAKTALTELRAYRRLNSVVPALNVVDGPVERKLGAALGGGGESQLPLIEIRDLQPTTPANGPE